jgi:primase-polymerase (primpol)-like protein
VEAAAVNVEIGIPPLELRERDQWLCWRYTVREGKRTKMPVNPHTGDLASSTDPNTWASYEEVVAARDARDLDGVGFVLTPDDPFCAIDLDDVRDAETGELEKWVLKVVRALDSYTEVSPSGEGVHVFVRGELPPGGRKRGRFECYDRSRFFTVTGEHLDRTPYEVVERGRKLKALHRRVFGEPAKTTNGHGTRREGNGLSDQEIVARAMRARNGGEFAKLWGGELNGHASHSEADLALCSRLAFWTGGDPGAMDRLFRQSGLMRHKWDGWHYGDGRTYGQATIEKALEGTAVFHDPKSQSLYRDGTWDGSEDESKAEDEKPPLRSIRFNEILDPGPRRYLLEGLVPEGYPTLLHGDGGSAKSMLALSFGLALARKADGQAER